MSYASVAGEFSCLGRGFGCGLGVGLGALQVRPAMPAGTYPGNPAHQREALTRGTVNGGTVRGTSRSEWARTVRCMIDTLPTVPAGTADEQRAFIQPFAQYCKSAALAQGAAEGPLSFSPSGPNVDSSGASGLIVAPGPLGYPVWAWAAGALVTLIAVGATVNHLSKRLPRRIRQPDNARTNFTRIGKTMYARTSPSPFAYATYPLMGMRGLGGGFSVSFKAGGSGGGGGAPPSPQSAANVLNDSMSALARAPRTAGSWFNRGGSSVTTSTVGGSPQKAKAAVPPAPSDILPAIPPGMYPGVDDHASQMRIYGTVNGAAVRGFTPDQLVQFIRCVNGKLPQGLPAQSKWQREIMLGPIRYQCMIAVLKDPTAKDAPAADAALALTQFKLSPSALQKIARATAPAIPLVRLPGGVIRPVTSVPPAVASTGTTTGASATDAANAADANASGADIVALGMTGTELGVAAAAVAAIVTVAYFATKGS